MMALGSQAGPGRILIDSGSEVTACPSDFGSGVLEEPEKWLSMQGVDGSVVKHYGAKSVGMRLMDANGVTKDAEVRFQVASVKRPVMSVGELLNKGFEVHFQDGQGWIAKGDTWIELERIGNRFMLRADENDGSRTAPNRCELCPLDRSDDINDEMHAPFDQDAEEEMYREEASAYQEQNFLVEEAPAGPAAVAPREVAQPTADEKMRQELTHADYKPWCGSCRGAGSRRTPPEGGRASRERRRSESSDGLHVSCTGQ